MKYISGFVVFVFCFTLVSASYALPGKGGSSAGVSVRLPEMSGTPEEPMPEEMKKRLEKGGSDVLWVVLGVALIGAGALALGGGGGSGGSDTGSVNVSW